MNLYLQFGHGMMAHSRELLSAWNGGGVILSPRDLSPTQLTSLASDLLKIPNSEILLDPQFYSPHSDHPRLIQHAYWPQGYQTGVFLSGAGIGDLTKNLTKLNHSLKCTRLICPGFYCQKVDVDWLAAQKTFIAAARSHWDGPVLATIALSWGVLKDDAQMSELIDSASSWGADGYYVVPEHPPQQYIIDDPIWLANLLDLVAALKLHGKSVIVGYGNQQSLILASAKVDAVASGTWMNVRSFTVDRFDEPEDDIKRKAVWFYSPHLLSEFKVTSLDVAKRLGLLPALRPQGDFLSSYVKPAFSGAAPSASLDEPRVFRHYLHALRMQAHDLSLAGFDETLNLCRRNLENAEKGLKDLEKKSVKGETRDFLPGVPACLQALQILESSRGPMLRRMWSGL